MFPFTPEHKIVIDPFTRKVLIGQMAIDLGLKKEGLISFVDNYFSTELKNAKEHGLEVWLKEAPKQVESYLMEMVNLINQALGMRIEAAPKEISHWRVKEIVYTAMKVQQVWDEHIRERTAKVKNTWVIQEDGYEALVSGYNWNIICIRYPWCQGKEKKSLIKLEMDRETMTKYDGLVRNNPWAYVPIEKDSDRGGCFVSQGTLYCPEEWRVDTIEIAETFLEEEDIRILKLKG